MKEHEAELVEDHDGETRVSSSNSLTDAETKSREERNAESSVDAHLSEINSAL